MEGVTVTKRTQVSSLRPPGKRGRGRDWARGRGGAMRVWGATCPRGLPRLLVSPSPPLSVFPCAALDGDMTRHDMGGRDGVAEAVGPPRTRRRADAGSASQMGSPWEDQ